MRHYRDHAIAVADPVRHRGLQIERQRDHNVRVEACPGDADGGFLIMLLGTMKATPSARIGLMAFALQLADPHLIVGLADKKLAVAPLQRDPQAWDFADCRKQDGYQRQRHLGDRIQQTNTRDGYMPHDQQHPVSGDRVAKWAAYHGGAAGGGAGQVQHVDRKVAIPGIRSGRGPDPAVRPNHDDVAKREGLEVEAAEQAAGG